MNFLASCCWWNNSCSMTRINATLEMAHERRASKSGCRIASLINHKMKTSMEVASRRHKSPGTSRKAWVHWARSAFAARVAATLKIYRTAAADAMVPLSGALYDKSGLQRPSKVYLLNGAISYKTDLSMTRMYRGAFNLGRPTKRSQCLKLLAKDFKHRVT